MKKNLLKAAIAAGLALSLTACGSVSQDYCDKINAAAATEKTNDDYTFSKITKDLGEGQSVLISGTGVATWTVTKGNTTKTLVVTFKSNVATGATYGESTSESSK